MRRISFGVTIEPDDVSQPPDGDFAVDRGDGGAGAANRVASSANRVPSSGDGREMADPHPGQNRVSG